MRLRGLLSYPTVYWIALFGLILVDVAAVVFGYIDDEQVRELKLSLVELAMSIAVVGIAGGLLKRAFDEQDVLAAFRSEVTSALSELFGKTQVLRRALA